jgi:hypothetical protein
VGGVTGIDICLETATVVSRLKVGIVADDCATREEVGMDVLLVDERSLDTEWIGRSGEKRVHYIY